MEENIFRKLRREKDDKTEWKDYTVRELSQELGIAAPKISEIEHGRRPSINEMQAYHRVFKVPYEYMLEESTSRYYENQSLSEELGLSDKAINILKEWHNVIGYNALIHGGEVGVLDLANNLENEDQAAIDFLLSNEKGRLLLSYISSYLYGDYVESEGNENTSIMLHNKKMGYNRPFDTRLIKAGLLVNIQNVLLEYDKQNHKGVDGNGNNNTQKE